MFKYLPPKSGLGHLGEQCGIDLYENIDDIMNHCDKIRYLEVSIFHIDYKVGLFHGWELQQALDWLTEHPIDEYEFDSIGD